MMRYIAIDPGGSSGGIAWRDEDGVVRAAAMPEGMPSQVDLLRGIAASLHVSDVLAVRENVGAYMPGNSGVSAATFAGHCAGLDYALYALGIPSGRPVAPQSWQKPSGWGVSKHLPAGYRDLPEGKAKKQAHAAAKRAHKGEIKDAMQARHPHLRVTLATADALAILGYLEVRDKGGKA
jgi:hypothetical protein